MNTKIIHPLMVAAALVPVSHAGAAIILDTTPANNQANLDSQAGQTFTLGTLGAQNQLSSITVQGPQSFFEADPTGPYTVKVWEDTDGDFATWDPGSLIATSTNTIPIDSANDLFTFDFSNEILNDDTVYAFSFTDAGGDHAGFRSGLTNEAGVALTDGALFSAGAQPFGGAFDVSFQLSTVPEPAVAVLGGLGLIGLLRRRR